MQGQRKEVGFGKSLWAHLSPVMKQSGWQGSGLGPFPSEARPRGGGEVGVGDGD